MLYFTQDHEWIKIDGETGTVGITDFAQEQLGDVVYVEVPEVGASYTRGAESAVVESVKAASELYAPVGGEVIEGNAALVDDPSLVNSDPMGAGWFYTLKLVDKGELDDLMDEAAYKDFVAGLE